MKLFSARTRHYLEYWIPPASLLMVAIIISFESPWSLKVWVAWSLVLLHSWLALRSHLAQLELERKAVEVWTARLKQVQRGEE